MKAIKYVLRKCLLLAILFALLFPALSFSETKEIIAEGTYNMGDGETPVVAEKRALLNAKRTALEQAGTYVRSHSKMVNSELTEDEIEVIASGITEVEILDKKRTVVGDGINFWVKIRARVQSEKMEEMAKRVKKDKELVDNYKQIQEAYNKSQKDIEELKRQLSEAKTEIEKKNIEASIKADENRLTANEWLEIVESKGLAEFNAENDTIYTMSSQDKKMVEEMMPIFQLMGDAKDIEKNKQTVTAFSKIIEEYPEYSDAYLLRATLSLLVSDSNYQKIISDIDNAIKFHASNKYTNVYNSTAEMYSLRTKVDMLAGNYQQAMSDLETAIKTDPDKINDVFKTGGVKPEDDSNPTALQKRDLDLLVSKYPSDYRTYMFRGLFYSSFTFGGEQYYAPALNDLKQALKVNLNSAFVNYFLGSITTKMTFWTKAAASDISDITGARGGYREKTNAIALEYFN